jgi:hypothetical protein
MANPLLTPSQISICHPALSNRDRKKYLLKKLREELFGNTTNDVEKARNFIKKQNHNEEVKSVIGEYIVEEYKTREEQHILLSTRIPELIMNNPDCNIQFLFLDMKHKKRNTSSSNIVSMSSMLENLQCISSLSRVFMQEENQMSYEKAFQMMFHFVPRGKFGSFLERIVGILLDFSSAERNGVVSAITQLLVQEGFQKERAREIALSKLKGCGFHFKQSAERIKRFLTDATKREKFDNHVQLITNPESTQAQVLQSFHEIKQLNTKFVEWTKWWTHDQILKLLCSSFSDNNNFNEVPFSNSLAESANALLQKTGSLFNQIIQCYTIDYNIARRYLDCYSNGQNPTYYLNNALKRKEPVLERRAPDCNSLIEQSQNQKPSEQHTSQQQQLASQRRASHW